MKLNKEELLVLLLTKALLDEDEVKKLNELIRDYLNWEKVIGYLQIHRVNGIAWNNIKKYVLVNGDEKCTLNKLFYYLKNHHTFQHLKAKEQAIQTLNVCKTLEENNIQYALLKGLVLSVGVYQDLGSRDFGDNDILIHSSDINKTSQLLDCVNLLWEEYFPFS